MNSFHGWMLIKEHKGIPPTTILGTWIFCEEENTWRRKHGRVYPANLCEVIFATEKGKWVKQEEKLEWLSEENPQTD